MKKTLIYMLALAAASFTAAAQDSLVFRPGRVVPMEGAFLEQLEKRDSILIADQVEYGFTIKDVPREDILVPSDLPAKGEELVPGVEVISGWQIDTLGLPKKKKAPRKETYDLRAAFRLASFEDGDFSLPPIAVLRIKPDMSADPLGQGTSRRHGYLRDPRHQGPDTLPADLQGDCPVDSRCPGSRRAHRPCGVLHKETP